MPKNKNNDEKRTTQCVNMCNSSSCPGTGSFDELANSEKNSNIVVVRDKWKRRRLNMVLIGTDSPDQIANKWVEPQAPITHLDVNPYYSGSIPASLSNILRPRK